MLISLMTNGFDLHAEQLDGHGRAEWNHRNPIMAGTRARIGAKVRGTVRPGRNDVFL